jgi:hypothetical protein
VRNPLWPYRKKVSSQNGEDGIIERIFELIGTTNKWCVEFGAWDGRFNSNSHYWIHDHGWSGVLIEADPEKFRCLDEYYSDRRDVHRFHARIGRANPLDGFLAAAKVPRNPDLLSIDIDGMDYWIWHDLVNYRPRVIVIEVNVTCPPHIRLIPAYKPDSYLSASARAMVELGKMKGYELAAMVQGNCIFVLSEEFDRLGIKDNNLNILFNSPHVPVVVSDQVGNHYVLSCGGYGIAGLTIGAPPDAQTLDYAFDPEMAEIAQMRSLERDNGDP